MCWIHDQDLENSFEKHLWNSIQSVSLQWPARISILENYQDILDFVWFLIYFHFSISISSHFCFTFISWKEWNLTPSFMKNLTIRGGWCALSNRSKSVLFRLSKILENSREISLLDLEAFSFHFHFSISISSKKNSLALLEKSIFISLCTSR